MKAKSVLTAVAFAAISSAAVFGVLGCDNGGNDGPQVPTHEPVTIELDKARYVVEGYEWGPAVPKLIFDFDGQVTGVDKDTFDVKVWKKDRVVTDAYVCDENGAKATSGTHFAVEMTVRNTEASPFSSRSQWSAKYKVSFTVADGKSFKVGDTEYVAGDTVEYDCTAAERLTPQLDSWEKDSFTHDGITLTRASWAPTGAADDGKADPLVIWLHGRGEGGTDIDLALLGSEVTALTTENKNNVQGYFATDGCVGAYVLAVQTPTMWMDIGTGENNDSINGDGQVSKYTEVLYEAIVDYVEECGDIDPDRIYIGGCSNGGYMTMNMMFEHTDFFAAYYPLCEAYMNGNISDAMIEATKDCNVWFVHSENDTTIDPQKTSVPTFYRYIDAGAQNMHLTYLDHITGQDDTQTLYDGHFSWVHALNDDVKVELDNAEVAKDCDNVTIGDDGAITSENNYVNPANCTVKTNMWQWLAQQTRSA